MGRVLYKVFMGWPKRTQVQLPGIIYSVLKCGKERKTLGILLGRIGQVECDVFVGRLVKFMRIV